MRLFKSGAVQGTQSQGNLFGGSIKMGASRLLVRMRVEQGEVKQIDCPCRWGQQHRVCQHGVAVVLQWVKANRSEESAESMVFATEHVPTRVELVKWFGDDAVARVTD